MLFEFTAILGVTSIVKQQGVMERTLDLGSKVLSFSPWLSTNHLWDLEQTV